MGDHFLWSAAGGWLGQGTRDDDRKRMRRRCWYGADGSAGGNEDRSGPTGGSKLNRGRSFQKMVDNMLLDA